MTAQMFGAALAVSLASAGIFGAATASAACLPQGPSAHAFTLQEATERSTGLVMISSVLLQLPAYGPTSLAGEKPSCVVATLEAGKRTYSISGTVDEALPRIVTAGAGGAPGLFLMTVADMTGILTKANLPPGPLGYVLASRDDKVALVYRAYDSVPVDTQLASDVAAVLESRVSPMARVDIATHKVQITTAADAGSVVARASGITPPSVEAGLQPVSRKTALAEAKSLVAETPIPRAFKQDAWASGPLITHVSSGLTCPMISGARGNQLAVYNAGQGEGSDIGCIMPTPAFNQSLFASRTVHSGNLEQAFEQAVQVLKSQNPGLQEMNEPHAVGDGVRIARFTRKAGDAALYERLAVFQKGDWIITQRMTSRADTIAATDRVGDVTLLANMKTPSR